jgi:putative membrane protein
VKRLISQILAGILGFYLAIRFIPDVEFTGSWQILILAGLVLGLINFFLKPILKIITLPIRIFTFGLFSLVINMGMIWVIAHFFPQLKIFTILSLFLTSIIVWGLNLILPLFIRSKK